MLFNLIASIANTVELLSYTLLYWHTITLCNKVHYFVV